MQSVSESGPFLFFIHRPDCEDKLVKKTHFFGGACDCSSDLYSLSIVGLLVYSALALYTEAAAVVALRH